MESITKKTVKIKGVQFQVLARIKGLMSIGLAQLYALKGKGRNATLLLYPDYYALYMESYGIIPHEGPLTDLIFEGDNEDE